MSKYTGFDKVATAKLPAVEQFVHLMNRRWGFTNLGTLNVRLMRSAPAGTKDNDPKWMSVHATGRAADCGFNQKADHAKVVEAITWLTRPDVVEALGIEEIHDYSGLSKKGTEQWGRGWRVFRKDLNKAGWKDWSAKDNGGTPGADWIHVEISPAKAHLSGDEYEHLWRSLPKP